MGEYLSKLVDALYLICNLTQEAGLETVLSAAFSLKHTASMKKSFPTQEEALNKAKELALNPVAALKCVQAPYVKGKFIKPPDFMQPKADVLVQTAQTEKGRSEVSCVVDQDNQGFLKATPMIHTDDSRLMRNTENGTCDAMHFHGDFRPHASAAEIRSDAGHDANNIQLNFANAMLRSGDSELSLTFH